MLTQLASEFSAALSKAKFDIAVEAVGENCKVIDNSDPPLACQCALTYSDYENEMAHQIQFKRCLNGEVPAELTDTEKLIPLDVLRNLQTKRQILPERKSSRIGEKFQN